MEKFHLRNILIKDRDLKMMKYSVNIVEFGMVLTKLTICYLDVQELSLIRLPIIILDTTWRKSHGPHGPTIHLRNIGPPYRSGLNLSFPLTASGPPYFGLFLIDKRCDFGNML